MNKLKLSSQSTKQNLILTTVGNVTSPDFPDSYMSCFAFDDGTVQCFIYSADFIKPNCLPSFCHFYTQKNFKTLKLLGMSDTTTKYYFEFDDGKRGVLTRSASNQKSIENFLYLNAGDVKISINVQGGNASFSVNGSEAAEDAKESKQEDSKEEPAKDEKAEEAPAEAKKEAPSEPQDTEDELLRLLGRKVITVEEYNRRLQKIKK